MRRFTVPSKNLVKLKSIPYLPGNVKSVCLIKSAPVSGFICSVVPEKYVLKGDTLSDPYMESLFIIFGRSVEAATAEYVRPSVSGWI